MKGKAFNRRGCPHHNPLKEASWPQTKFAQPWQR